MHLPNLTADILLAFLAGAALAYLFTRFVERTGRTPADGDNVQPVREDEAAPLRALFTQAEEEETGHPLPPQIGPAKRRPGRPRKTATPITGGQVLDGPYPAYTDEEMQRAKDYFTEERAKRAPKPKRTH
jgi:hypothetical protein